ncbi:hypothetical protein CE91St44_33320 [Oscillospiraceae bacterium]|nr:hypothetical protein CE91St44_33320 [Oscillospiraceae bacterium]
MKNMGSGDGLEMGRVVGWLWTNKVRCYKEQKAGAGRASPPGRPLPKQLPGPGSAADPYKTREQKKPARGIFRGLAFSGPKQL